MNVVLFGEVSTDVVLGGAERMLRNQAMGLQKLGCTVTVISRSPEGDPRPEVLLQGIKEYRYDVSRKNETAFVLSSLRHSLNRFDAVRARLPVDVGIIHQSLAGLGPLVCRKHSVRSWIYMCLSLAHEEFVTRQSPSKVLMDRLRFVVNARMRLAIERAVMRRCDRVLVMSKFMRERVQAAHHIPDHKIDVVPGASDLSRFHPPQEVEPIRRQIGVPLDRVVLWTVRNLVPRMGLENLIQAMVDLGDVGRDVLLMIGGEGPLRKKLEVQVEQLNLRDKVRFLGFVPEEVLPSYYQAADLVVMPTHQLEGFGLVTVEALACGTPVLGTPVGATPEILGQIDPMLVAESADAKGLAMALRRILERYRADPGLRQRHSEQGRALVERNYTWDEHAARLAVVLQDCGVPIAA